MFRMMVAMTISSGESMKVLLGFHVCCSIPFTRLLVADLSFFLCIPATSLSGATERWRRGSFGARVHIPGRCLGIPRIREESFAAEGIF